MKLGIEEFRDAVGLLGEAGGAEVAIVAQLVLDLTVTARFIDGNKAVAIDDARKILRLRIARYRAGASL